MHAVEIECFSWSLGAEFCHCRYIRRSHGTSSNFVNMYTSGLQTFARVHPYLTSSVVSSGCVQGNAYTACPVRIA